MNAATPPYVLIDGNPSATISVLDRGLLFGHGVFDTLRTYGGRPFAVREHMERLIRSALAAHIPLKTRADELVKEVESAIRSADFSESYVRVMVTAGEGPLELVPRELPTPRRIVIVAPLRETPPELYASGVRAKLLRTLRAGDAAGILGAKLLDYLPNISAVIEARSFGANEALLADGRGDVLQGASSNLFVVRSGALRTPPIVGATLRGITRDTILRLAHEAGIDAREEPVSIEELFRADELFLTSSLRGVMGCTHVDERPIGRGVPGPRTMELHRAYRLCVG